MESSLPAVQPGLMELGLKPPDWEHREPGSPEQAWTEPLAPPEHEPPEHEPPAAQAYEPAAARPVQASHAATGSMEAKTLPVLMTTAAATVARALPAPRECPPPPSAAASP